MLTPFDDYLIHQTIDTLDHVATGDPRFQDRGLFNIHAAGTDFLFQIGFGVFPNRDMIDGWVCGVHGDKQYNMRVARPLLHDRGNLNIGPLHIEVVEPMRVWRIWTDDNGFGVHCDVTFRSRTPAFEFRPVFIRRNNMVEHHQMHVMQSGSYQGWVEIGGTRFDAGLIGSRDRSWGVRGAFPNQVIDAKTHAPVGEVAKPAPREDKTRRAWISAEFTDYTLHGWFWTGMHGELLIADGAIMSTDSDGPGTVFCNWAEPRIERGENGDAVSVTLTLTDQIGGLTQLQATPYVQRSPEGNGYFKGYYGRKRLALHVEGESFDMSDAAFRQEHGYMNGPMLARFTHEGNVGYGVIITAMFARRR